MIKRGTDILNSVPVLKQRLVHYLIVGFMPGDMTCAVHHVTLSGPSLLKLGPSDRS